MRQSKIKDKLILRSKIVFMIRSFFIKKGYVEVDTPVRIPSPAPELYIDAQKSGSWYLQTSPELCMKELLAAGFENIFQISKCFRMDERGHKHLPEMNLLEWYCINKDYLFLMEQTEDLFRYIATELNGGNKLNYQNSEIDLSQPFDRITVRNSFDLYGSMSMDEALAEDKFDEILGLEIEPKLGQGKPVFLYNYPKEMGALARINKEDSSVAERFELYISGLELCNAFSELTDAKEQRERFNETISEREDLGKDIYPMAEKFLSILPLMPEAAGIALGVERLLMLFTDSKTIDDVTFFLPEEL